MTKTNDRIFLIYSMGKVGSSAVYYSLKSELPESIIFQVHFLSRKKLENELHKENPVFFHNITKGRKILQVIAQNPDKILTIITLTREPIIRDISDLFENWSHLYADIQNENITELWKQIDRRNPYYTLNWFDSEFKEYLGFDIYKQPFNKELGFEIYKHRDIDILCIKQEMLKVVGYKALKEFLGLDITLVSSNRSSDKRGSSLYEKLRENYVAPLEKIERIYSSKYVKHFYTDEEINEFITYWSKIG